MNSKQTISENIVNIQVFSDNQTLCSKNEQGTEDMDTIFGFDIDPFEIPTPNNKTFLSKLREMVIDNSKISIHGCYLDFDDLCDGQKEFIVEHIIRDDHDEYCNYYASQFVENVEAVREYFKNLFLTYQSTAQIIIDDMCDSVWSDYIREIGGRFSNDTETGERCVNF